LTKVEQDGNPAAFCIVVYTMMCRDCRGAGRRLARQARDAYCTGM